jgi:hypothetical protein
MGERIGGDMSPAEREQANLVFEMEDQIRMIDRRLEWMAARALSAGSITVAGDGFPTASITFGRSNGNTVALTSGQRWSTDSGVTPFSRRLALREHRDVGHDHAPELRRGAHGYRLHAGCPGSCSSWTRW